MPGDETQKALTRIEAALQRIERAATRPAETSSASPDPRHEALRAAVEATLSRLDAIIADQESVES